MSIFRCAHAPATFAFHGRPLTVSLCLPDEEQMADLSLVYTVTAHDGKGGGEGVLRMLPSDGIVGKESFTIYSALVPARALTYGGELFYHFVCSGSESTVYTVPLCDPVPLPPLLVTEYAPYLPPSYRFIELYNPTSHEVDLFDYKLLLLSDGAVLGRNALAAKKGQHVLPPKTACALHFLDPAQSKEQKSEDDFWGMLQRLFPEALSDLEEPRPLTVSATLTKAGFELPAVQKERYRLALVPRGGGAADAVFHFDPGCSSRSAFSSLLLQIDPRTPETGHLVASALAPTPGYLHEGQAYPDLDDPQTPVILPISPSGRVYLADGDLPIRFFVAGETAATPTVFARLDEGFSPIEATLGNDGVYQATLPYRELSRLPGRLLYYIEAPSALYTASLGRSSSPLSLKVVDNAGPTVLSCEPAPGQVLEGERSPTVRITYEDVSGVDLHGCALFLDGENLSLQAKWGANGVEFTPMKPLSYGEHAVELLLRDKRGNRTELHLGFLVSEGQEAPVAVKGRHKERLARLAHGALAPVRLTKLVAGTISTVKHLLHPEHDK